MGCEHKKFQIDPVAAHRNGLVIPTALSVVAAIDRGLISRDYEHIMPSKRTPSCPKPNP